MCAHPDRGSLLPGEDAPLPRNFLIISAKPVDALNDKGVARLSLFQQVALPGASKTFAQFRIQNSIACRQSKILLCNAQPCFMLMS